MVSGKNNDIPEYYFPPVGSGEVPAPPQQTTQEVPPSFAQPKRAKERSKVLPFVAVAAAAAIVGGAAGAGVAVVVGSQSNNSSINATATQGITVNDKSEVTQVTAVAAKASPSVVTIRVTGDSAAGSGSGVVISSDGYILTNNHVATLDGATGTADISVQDNDGNIYPAKVIGTDPTVDLAVIKIDAASPLTPIEWADSSKLNVGDLTIAMGAPLGLAGTVTTGIVSALNRSIQIASSAVPDSSSSDSGDTSNPFDLYNFDFGQGDSSTQQSADASISIPVVQTDAAINPGNSGGALLDSEGKLIGINVAIASAGSSEAGSIGVGFALPSNLAKRVSEELIANQSATHGLLGAKVSDAGSKEGSTAVGAYIEEVVDGGAAQKGGVANGDIITQFNGVRITDANDLTAQVRTAAGGSDATVVVSRNGKTETLKVKLGTL